MTHSVPPTLGWLCDLTPALGAQIDLVLEGNPQESGAPVFSYGPDLPSPRAIPLPTGEADDTAWRQSVASTLADGNWATCLVNLLTVPVNTVRSEVNGRPLRDGAAFLLEVLKHAADGSLIVAVAPSGIALNQSAATLRAWLAETHRIEWIIYLGPDAARLLGAHPHFGAVLLVIRAGAHTGPPPKVLRLVNLSTSPQADWASAVLACSKRGGGEVGHSIVLRDQVLDSAPWTYERFSRDFSTKRQDAKHLGTLRLLRDFVEDIRPGLHRTVEAHRFIELDDTGAVPEGTVPCFSGRSVEPGGRLGPPVCAVLRKGLPDDLLLKPGDVLVRSIVNLRADEAPVIAAIVDKDALPATFDRTCIRIRWSTGLRSQVANLLAGYLNSTHARDGLVARGVHLSLNPDTLGELEVPDPSDDVLGALQILSDAEKQYRDWATEVAGTRGSIFATTSLQDQLSALLLRKRIEMERLQAARDAAGFDYQVRNYFPYPIALRRDSIAQSAPGKPKIDAVLECAEHLLTLLAILAICQESWGETGSARVKARLMSFTRDGELHLDWGKCVGLLQEGAELTARHANPLALPFPDLAELAPAMSDSSSAWSVAERHLREWRNNQAHLQRRPEPEFHQISDEFVGLLDDLLKTVSFLGIWPLVQVADYELHPATQKRQATFQILQGISAAFRRRQYEVALEIPRGAVGFLTGEHTFVSAFPWLVMETCPTCKRPEVFVFNRYQRNVATYIAMETGHPRDNQALAAAIDGVIHAPLP